jgi:2Fe-2S ferredoxin
MPKTHKVNFSNVNRIVDANEGDTLLETALAHDVPLMHACGGFCACTTCHVKVTAGESSLSQMEDEESDRIETAEGYSANSRLGCQAKVTGPVTVEIMNVDR